MPSYHFRTALTPEGWRDNVTVTVAHRDIVAVTAGTDPPPDAHRMAGVAIPGVANVHSHAFQRAMAGLVERRGPEEDSFWTWREVMYRFLAAMTPDDVEAVAAQLYVEMLEAGFTCVGEFHYLHHAPDGRPYADPAETAGRVVAAAAMTGIGLTLLPSFYAHGGCGGRPPTPGQRRFVCDVEGFGRLMEGAAAHVARHPGARLGIAPHSLRAVAPDELAALLRQYASGPVHMHAAEQTGEVDECVAWSGLPPVTWLLEHAAVDARWCLIHCTHMTEAERTALARSGAVAGLCPITEANLGDGIFEAPRYLEAGGRIAVGSDSNVRIALGEELRTLEYGQRLRERKRNRLGPAGSSTGRHLFDAARIGGAQALHQPMGSIDVGRVADLVVLDDAHPVLVGRRGDALLDAFVFAGGDGLVRDVIAGGRHVVRDGRHVARTQIAQRYAIVADRLAALL